MVFGRASERFLSFFFTPSGSRDSTYGEASEALTTARNRTFRLRPGIVLTANSGSD